MSLLLTRQDDRADIVSVSGNYSITGTTTGVVLVTTGSSDATITLPAASTSSKRTILVKKVDSGSGRVLIQRSGSDSIEGQTIVYIYKQYDWMQLITDGTSWYVEQERITPVVLMSYNASSTEVSTASTGAEVTSAWPSMGNTPTDNYSIFTASTATFVVPVGMGGWYELTISLTDRVTTTTSNGTGNAFHYAALNGANGAGASTFISITQCAGVTTDRYYQSGVRQFLFSAGDSVQFRASVSGGSGGGTDTYRFSSPMLTVKLLQRVR